MSRQKRPSSFVLGRPPAVLALAMALVTLLLPVNQVLADTNGPGAPTTNFPFPPNACGPCTDANRWSLDPGTAPNIGNGVCGRCGNKGYQRTTGSCQGTDPGPPFNCKNGKCDSKATYHFRSTPVGGLTYAGCLAAAIAGGILAEVAVLVACTGVCVTAGVVTLGAACIACITANVTVASVAACAFSDCIEDCNFINNTWANKAPCCN